MAREVIRKPSAVRHAARPRAAGATGSRISCSAWTKTSSSCSGLAILPHREPRLAQTIPERPLPD